MTQPSSLKQEVLRSLAWSGGLRYLGQIITWGITLFVIRLLNPDDYGLMAKAYLCIGFLVMFSELGLAAAVVQKKDINHYQLGQVFGFVILVNVFMAILLFSGAPLAAHFFGDGRLIPIFRFLSVVFLLIACYVVPDALLTREMDFQRKSMVELLGAIVSSGTTLFLALHGYGVWSLVWGVIGNYFMVALSYHVVKRVWIRPRFRFQGFKYFASFGGLMTANRIFWYLYSQADIFIASRFLSNSLLGTYSVAANLSSMPLDKVAPIMNQVAFPAYSSIKNDTGLVRSHFLKSVRLVSLIAFPLFWGLLATSPEFIPMFLSPKWSGLIIPLQLLCIIMPLRMLGTLFAPVFQGLGDVKITLVNNLIIFVVMVFAFCIGIKWGVSGICIGWVLGYSAAFAAICRRSLLVLRISIRAFLSSMEVPFIAGLCMVVLLLAIKQHVNIIGYSYLLLGMCILIGGVVYVGLIFMMSRDLLREILTLLKRREARNSI